MIYRIVKNKPHPYIHRYHELVVLEELIFACKIRWITNLVFFFSKNCQFETQEDEVQDCYWGKELSEDWCKIYGVKRTEDVWSQLQEKRKKSWMNQHQP